MMCRAVPLIAVIDDDPAIVEVLCDVLTDVGYCTIRSFQATEVLPLIQQIRPDLVIIDLHLGGGLVDGWDVILQIYENRSSPPIPVIVCSADRTFLLTQQARLHDLGCDILEKPFDLDDLLAKVEMAVGPAHPRVRAVGA